MTRIKKPHIIAKEKGLDRFRFVGYVIHLFDQEEFLVEHSEDQYHALSKWGDVPDFAATYNLGNAQRIAKSFEYKHPDVCVCYLFETDNQYVVSPIEESF